MQYPTNINEWWSNVLNDWENLWNLMTKFLPMDAHGNGVDYPIELKLHQHIIHLKESKDSELAKWFQLTWSSAPDQPWLHQLHGWHTLCDLCSESWVLEDMWRWK